MKDAELYSVAGMSSSSPAMFERRRRILTEARKLIGKGHPDGFNVRELCEKAGVAPNTLYNAFGSKENVITIAISQYFEEFHSKIEFQYKPETFNGVLEREMTTTIRNLSITHYVRAISDLFFSPTATRALRATLVRIAERPYLPWLQEIRIGRQLEKGVQLERVVANLATMLFALVQEWRVGELNDETFITARLDAVLSYLAGVTKGEARREVRAMFADLNGGQKRVRELVEHSNLLLSSAVRSR